MAATNGTENSNVNRSSSPSRSKRNGNSTTTRQEYQALLTAASHTAGSNTWKTYSGRIDGPDEFLYGDLFRFAKSSMRRHFVKSSAKKRGDVCPVCMEDPMSNNSTDDIDNKWYVTKSCNHAVCRECLQSYANSLIADPNHSGPLKCPCCPRLLRVEDARVALSNPSLEQNHTKKNCRQKCIPENNDELVADATLDDTMAGDGHEGVTQKSRVLRRPSFKQSKRDSFLDADNDNAIQRSELDVLVRWDKKVRNDFLRSMPDFRPCPHCSNSAKSTAVKSSPVGIAGDELANDSSSEKTSTDLLGGGGFVTAECLAPINEGREANAVRYINFAGAPTVKLVLISYVIYFVYYTQSVSSSEESSNSMDSNTKRITAMIEIFMTLFPTFLVPISTHALRLALAKRARKELVDPIIVVCPCCDKDFNLHASSEFQMDDTPPKSTAESASEQWKGVHTRPCPGCASPIMKDGGCNHVKCGKCRVDFCWACMRTRTTCRAFQCQNGAPYGSAVSVGLAAVEREGQTLMERIDHVEQEALQNLRSWNMPLVDYLPYLWVIYAASPFVYNCMVSLLKAFGLVAFFSLMCIGSRGRGASNNRNRTNPIRNGGNDNSIRQGLRLGFGRPRRGSRTVVDQQWRRSLRLGFRTEVEMVSEAIARSLMEQ